MASIEQTRGFPDKSIDQCFNAAPNALTGAGFELFKSRPIGWLVMSQIDSSDGYITANIAIRPGAQTGVTLSINGDKASPDAVNQLAQKIWDGLELELK